MKDNYNIINARAIMWDGNTIKDMCEQELKEILNGQQYFSEWTRFTLKTMLPFVGELLSEIGYCTIIHEREHPTDYKGFYNDLMEIMNTYNCDRDLAKGY